MNGITLFSIIITLGAYLVSGIAARRYPSPWTTPVFFSTTIVIVVLVISGISYEAYTPAKDIMTYLLGPATVALAVPLYHNRAVLKERLLPAAAGLVLGTASTIVSAVLIAKFLNLSEDVAASAGAKSVTTPVAIEAAKIIGGDPALSAIFVMITGMFGAMFGPYVLSLMRVKDPFSRGLAIGTIAHGIGTAQAAAEGRLQGAVSGAAMGFAAIITSFILPWLFPFLF
ncbi:MAG TPA: LrgB family protein [Chondromyces sp.]|nr:LrgB family protein [Chondromyces sp.]